MDLPIYKISVQDCEFLEVALVDDPAINVDFLAFKKDQPMVFAVANEDKHIITGPVMIPNQLIYRKDKLGERYVYYDNETISRSAQLFLKNGMKFNEMHTKTHIDSIELIESYLAKEPNQFNVPDGSWILTGRVTDESVWQRIKTGEFNGFSFQSIFENVLEDKFNKQDDMNDLKVKLLSAINEILFGKATETPITTVTEVPVEVVVDVIVPETEIAMVDVPVPVEEPAQEAVVKDEKPGMSDEEMLAKVGTMLEEFSVKILAAVDEKLASVKTDMQAVDQKVEEFGKQPLTSKTKTEIVNAPQKFDSPVARFMPKS